MNSLDWSVHFFGFEARTRPSEPARAPVASLEARSWLLRVGWLRHGKIGVTEAPKLETRAAKRSKRRA